MSKKRWQLKSVAQILRSIKERKNSHTLAQAPRALILDDFSRQIISQIKTMDEKVQILERNFPIQEGRACVDLLAHNQAGELILIWCHENLKAQRLIELISEYDWMKKNASLWQHLFPQAKLKNDMNFKVWFFASEMDANLNTILFYLKGIPLKIFQYSYKNFDNKVSMVIKPWMQLKSEANPLTIPSEERPNFKSHSKKAVSSTHLRAVPPPKEIPSITQEEIQDLVKGLEDPFNPDDFEDEITEPSFDVRDLKVEKA